MCYTPCSSSLYHFPSFCTLLPPHPVRPLLGITGSRSPASFQLGNIAAQFEEEEEEEGEDGSEDSPTEDEEVRSQSTATCPCVGMLILEAMHVYMNSYVSTYV